MSSIVNSPLTPSASTSLLSRRRWLRGSRILPLKIATTTKSATTCQQDTNSITSSTTAIGSPSSVKLLFPSLSMFNLPSASILTPKTTGSKEVALLPPPPPPPPQFAVDHTRRHRILKKLKPRKRIQKAYPSAFETYLFDDALPGLPNQGIQPVRLLLERLQAWYLLAKRLLRHFELLASVEHRVSKTYRKLDRVTIFSAPRKHRRRITTHKSRRTFHKDERLLKIHFAFQGGVRGVCDAWQHYHTDTAKDHAEFATFLRNEAMPTLKNIKRELKWMIKSIRADDRLSLRTLTSLKREAAKRLKRLDRQLVFFDEHPYHGYTKKDPWLINAGKYM